MPAEWNAFNDHRPSALTSPNATGYDLIGTGERGLLRDHATGTLLPVTLTVSSVNAQNFGTNSNPNPGTPAFNLFSNAVDMGNPGIVAITASAQVTISFTGLDPMKRYSFRGTAIRGNNYADRWTICGITGAGAYTQAHIDGSANNNLITKEEFPSAILSEGEVAFCSGHNLEGSVVGWDHIDPGLDGSFSVVNGQYFGPTPFGNTVSANAPYSYALNAILLSQLAPHAPNIIANPRASTTLSEGLTFSLHAAATGSPPLAFQWHKEGIGPLPGATQNTYAVAQAALSDAGRYHVVVSNDLGEAASSTAEVVVSAQTGPLVQLQWPKTASQTEVEMADDPAGPWSPLPGAVFDGGDYYQFTAKPSARAGFFRLRGHFGNPAPVPLFNSSVRERGASFSTDGLTFYFSSESSGNFDILSSSRATLDSPWQTPVRINTLNTTGDDVFPVITANGLSLYFSDYFSRLSLRPRNRGIGDIWVSRRASEFSSWQAAVNLGPVVNSSANEYSLAISSDELELFFASDRTGGYGQADLWMSTRTNAANVRGWLSAQNLGSSINSTYVDCCPFLSRDGLSLYFSSNRPAPGLPAGINRIWVAHRNSRSEPFGSPDSLGRHFPDFSNMVDPCFAPDGSTFLFTTLGRLSSPAATGDIWQVPVFTPPLSISLLTQP